MNFKNNEIFKNNTQKELLFLKASSVLLLNDFNSIFHCKDLHILFNCKDNINNKSIYSALAMNFIKKLLKNNNVSIITNHDISSLYKNTEEESRLTIIKTDNIITHIDKESEYSDVIIIKNDELMNHLIDKPYLNKTLIYTFNNNLNNTYFNFKPITEIKKIKNVIIKQSLKLKHLSEEQILFYYFLKIYNIKQIYISKSLIHFNRIIKYYNLKEYNNINEPVLIFGMYMKKDLKVLEDHKGKKFVMFGGTDVDDRYEHRVEYIKILQKMSDVLFISNSENMLERLNRNKIKSVFLENDLRDHLIIKSDNIINNKKLNSIYIYDGNKRSHKTTYNKDICDEIEIKLRDKLKIYRTSKNEKVKYEEMIKFYKNFDLIIRLTVNDGGSETTKECRKINKVIVHNNSRYGLKWKNIDDVLHYIDICTKYNFIFNNSVCDTYYINLDLLNNIDIILPSVEKLNKDNIYVICFTNNKEIFDKYKYLYSFIKIVCNNNYIKKNIIDSEYIKNSDNVINCKNKILKCIFKSKKYIKNRFSIITPFYKMHHTIDTYLKCIKDIEYDNFEIIIIIDDPNDLCIEKKLIKFMNDNPTYLIKVIKNYENSGAYLSRNVGIFNSTGEYIYTLDPDDTIIPKKFILELELFKKHNADIINSKYIRKCLKTGKNITEAKYGEPGTTFHRKVFIQEGFYDKNRFAADTEFRLRIFKYYKYKRYRFDEITEIKTYDESEKSNNLTYLYKLDSRKQYVNEYTNWHKNNIEQEFFIKNKYTIYESLKYNY